VRTMATSMQNMLASICEQSISSSNAVLKPITVLYTAQCQTRQGLRAVHRVILDPVGHTHALRPTRVWVGAGCWHHLQPKLLPAMLCSCP
jgi:hypothetical protein